MMTIEMARESEEWTQMHFFGEYIFVQVDFLRNSVIGFRSHFGVEGRGSGLVRGFKTNNLYHFLDNSIFLRSQVSSCEITAPVSFQTFSHLRISAPNQPPHSPFKLLAI